MRVDKEEFFIVTIIKTKVGKSERNEESEFTQIYESNLKALSKKRSHFVLDPLHLGNDLAIIVIDFVFLMRFDP